VSRWCQQKQELGPWRYSPLGDTERGDHPTPHQAIEGARGAGSRSENYPSWEDTLKGYIPSPSITYPPKTYPLSLTQAHQRGGQAQWSLESDN
jgi:hypothetical protein